MLASFAEHQNVNHAWVLHADPAGTLHIVITEAVQNSNNNNSSSSSSSGCCCCCSYLFMIVVVVDVYCFVVFCIVVLVRFVWL